MPDRTPRTPWQMEAERQRSEAALPPSGDLDSVRQARDLLAHFLFDEDDADDENDVVAAHDLLMGMFPDHTHRWEERSQEVLDAEYAQTGASLGRWVCRSCQTETDAAPAAAPLTDPMIGTPRDGRHPDHACGQVPCPHVPAPAVESLTVAAKNLSDAANDILKHVAPWDEDWDRLQSAADAVDAILAALTETEPKP